MHTNPVPQLSGKKILVVEDDYICFQLLKEILSETGADIFHTDTVSNTLSWLTENPDVMLIFMDIQLPDMSGLQASAVIHKRFPNIPIIIQTAFALESYMKKSQEIGCTDYLIKPLEAEKVLSTILKYTPNHE